MISFPLIWSVLGSRQAPHNSEADALKVWATICSKTLQSCQSRYEGTDALIDHVSGLIERFGNGKIIDLGNTAFVAREQGPAGSASSALTTSKASGFGNVLHTKPLVYSQVVAALDIALSRGRMPQHEDFPAPLRVVPMVNAHSPLSRISLLDQALPAYFASLIRGNPSAAAPVVSGLARTEEEGLNDDVANRDDANRGKALQICDPSLSSLMSSDFSMENQETELLHQLLEGYAEAGLFPSTSMS